MTLNRKELAEARKADRAKALEVVAREILLLDEDSLETLDKTAADAADKAKKAHEAADKFVEAFNTDPEKAFDERFGENAAKYAAKQVLSNDSFERQKESIRSIAKRMVLRKTSGSVHVINLDAHGLGTNDEIEVRCRGKSSRFKPTRSFDEESDDE